MGKFLAHYLILARKSFKNSARGAQLIQMIVGWF